MPPDNPVTIDPPTASSRKPLTPPSGRTFSSPKVLAPAVAYMWVPDAAKIINYFAGVPEDIATAGANLLAVIAAIIVGYYVDNG